MSLLFHRIDVLPLLVIGDGLPLPDPKNYAAIGWLLFALWVLVKIADAFLNFYKRHIKQSIPSGDWASQKDLEDLKTELHNQLKEARAYSHQEIHELKDAVHDSQVSGDAGREGLHSRLGTIVELVHYMRGQNEGMLKACEVSSQSAERAAARAEEVFRRQS